MIITSKVVSDRIKLRYPHVQNMWTSAVMPAQARRIWGDSMIAVPTYLE